MSLPESILIVDDTEASRYLKARILGRAGYDVVEAATGAVARELVAKRDFAMALLDVKLPDVNGIDLCREFKQSKPEMLIMQTSAAFISQDDRVRGLAGGADSYLIEPIEPKELTATVEALLRRYRTERELREKHDTLEQVVAERSEQIAEIDARLKNAIDQRETTEDLLRHAQKLDVLGQLTGGIAHDFNNVLTIIMGNLESLRRTLTKPEPNLDRIRKHADSAFYGAKRAIGITRQLLAFSRRQPLAPRVLDVNAFVVNLEPLLKQVLGDRVSYECRTAANLWPVKCDAHQLETVILNLVVNARDAMPDGGTLAIVTENMTSTTGDADKVVLSVIDSGTGMSAEVIRYAFEPFFTTKDIGHGTGLGLSQAHGFMRQSGGEVRIDSAEGKGTKLQLLFPRYMGADMPVGPLKESPDHDVRAQRAERILIVEDDELVRQHTAGLLHELGHRVIESVDGPNAIELLSAYPDIHVLVTDVGLAGGMSGAAIARRAREINPAIKVIYTTGYAGERLAAEGIQPEDVVIHKPFTFEEFARKLDELIQGSDNQSNVLVIEDEPMIRMNLALSLGDLGFGVSEAGSLAEARAQLAGPTVGAIVIDVGLPDGRGDEFVQSLRQAGRDLPVIITTGYEDDALRRKFANDSRTVLVGKPCDPEDVGRTLNRLGVASKKAS